MIRAKSTKRCANVLAGCLVVCVCANTAVAGNYHWDAGGLPDTSVWTLANWRGDSMAMNSANGTFFSSAYATFPYTAILDSGTWGSLASPVAHTTVGDAYMYASGVVIGQLNFTEGPAFIIEKGATHYIGKNRLGMNGTSATGGTPGWGIEIVRGSLIVGNATVGGLIVFQGSTFRLEGGSVDLTRGAWGGDPSLDKVTYGGNSSPIGDPAVLAVNTLEVVGGGGHFNCDSFLAPSPSTGLLSLKAQVCTTGGDTNGLTLLSFAGAATLQGTLTPGFRSGSNPANGTWDLLTAGGGIVTTSFAMAEGVDPKWSYAVTGSPQTLRITYFDATLHVSDGLILKLR